MSKKHGGNTGNAQTSGRQRANGNAADTRPDQLPSLGTPGLVIGGVTMLAVITWGYWPTLVNMATEWGRQPDYSHEYLVAPIAALFLWLRRDRLSISEVRPNFWGAPLLLLACVSRVAAARLYMQPLDGWSLPISLAGAVLLLYGWSCLRWSLPSIAFLWFMVPIPFSAERWLSLPLQSLATKLSTTALVCLGYPAIAQGNVILLGDHQLFIAEACSGLRIFVGIFALAFAFVLFARWHWWQKTLSLVAVLPIAIAANVLRIVATGLLQELTSSEAAHKFSHDMSGFVMIPVAALMFWGFLMYLDRLFPVVEDVRISGLVSE